MVKFSEMFCGARTCTNKADFVHTSTVTYTDYFWCKEHHVNCDFEKRGGICYKIPEEDKV